MNTSQPVTDRLATRLFSLLAARHRWALIALLIFGLGYGCLVEIRGALIHTRHTDAGVYFAAAWRIRIGSDPYLAQDQNGWHYIIPPLLAVLMSPLADAPGNSYRYLCLPYALSIGIWFNISMLCMVEGVNRLAMALVRVVQDGFSPEYSQSDDPFQPDPLCPTLPARNTARRMAWRWWVLCFWPVLICLPATCRSVIRGQVGPLWLMLICMMIAEIIERRSFRAGIWLAGAICLKLIPIYLLIYPVWRRDWRMLGGCAIGLFVGLGFIPWIGMGSHEFVIAYHHYLTSLVLPSVVGGTIDPAIAHELTNPVTTDTQSLVAVLMHMGNTFFGTPLSYSPPLFAKLGHVLIGGLMTVLTLAAARAGKRREPLDEALFLGLLMTVSLPVSPVCHPHYYMLMLPVVAAVLATFLGTRGQHKVTPGWVAMLAMLFISHIITAMPGGQIFRDTGVVTWTAIAFWATTTRLLWKRTHGFVANPQHHGFNPLLNPASA
jgi:hypothetical protein